MAEEWTVRLLCSGCGYGYPPALDSCPRCGALALSIQGDVVRTACDLCGEPMYTAADDDMPTCRACIRAAVDGTLDVRLQGFGRA